MNSFKKFIANRKDLIAWIIFSICGITSFIGLIISSKELIAIAFGAIGMLVARQITLVIADNYRMKTRIRKARKRTSADMF